MTTDNPAGPTDPPPVTDAPPTPPPQPPAPPAPPAPAPQPPGDGQFFNSLQQSIDGLPETFINGMKEAFPVLSQPPSQTTEVPENTDTNVSAAEGSQPSRLTRFWFGK